MELARLVELTVLIVSMLQDGCLCWTFPHNTGEMETGCLLQTFLLSLVLPNREVGLSVVISATESLLLFLAVKTAIASKFEAEENAPMQRTYDIQ